LLYWYLAGAMWGRYSTSTESTLNRDLGVIEELDGALERLINELKMWKGDLRVFPAHFSGWSTGARFYPVLYLLTRIGEARDWGNGLPMKKQMLGKMSNLEVHHIFPKALLYRHNFRRPEVNAVANFCFLTKDTNLHISDSPPEVYFRNIASKHPGALESQWIPMDERLWKLENYRDFLEARRELLAEAANEFLVSLYPDHLEAPAATAEGPVTTAADAQRAAFGADVLGGVESEQEEQLLLDVNQWVIQQGLPEGAYLHELTDFESGTPLAIFDLAWPQGLQEELSEPVALLINEGPEVLAIANAHGFRYFTNVDMFKAYVLKDILADQEVA
jgi:hypothetical protein